MENWCWITGEKHGIRHLQSFHIISKKGEKTTVKIEWTPEGGESYISLKWQEPLSEEDQNSFSFSSEAGKQLDYYFIYGKNMDDVIGGYRNLTGKAPLVPKWALGFWQSRERVCLELIQM